MTRFYPSSNLSNRSFSVLLHNIILSSVFILSFLVFLGSCEENPSIIGKDLLPGKDFVSIRSTDTIKVNAYSNYTDSVISTNLQYSYLGWLHDPYFGDTRADFVAQLRLAQKWPGGGTPVIDSVELDFPISGAKKSLGVSPQIKLSEIDEILLPKTAYYSNKNVAIKGEIGTFTLPAITKDTSQNLRILLPDSIGTHLLRDTTKLSQDADGEPFRSFFKGLKISIYDTPDPLLLGVDFSSSGVVIRVYFSNESAAGQYFDFVIASSSIRFNRYSHNFSAADPGKKINHVNDGVKDTAVYLQSFNGIYPVLKIPGLEHFKDSLPISVNKAILRVPVFLDNNIYTTSTAPIQLLLSYTTSDGIKNILPDYEISSIYFGGVFSATNKTYTFNMAAFIQEYLEGRIPSSEVEIYFPDGEYQNVILKANQNPTPAVFEFTYTRF
jgi:hypothetical protein